MIPPYPGNRTYELYNIRKDPEQKNDLSESEPKVLRRMMMRFEELKRETGKKTNFKPDPVSGGFQIPLKQDSEAFFEYFQDNDISRRVRKGYSFR